MPKADPYVCPRCKYTVQTKYEMRRHLYDRKTACTNHNSLELTEEIKQSVLRDRKYCRESTISSTVQNSYVTNLEVNEKLDPYLSHMKKTITDINDYAENLYLQTVERLTVKITSKTHTVIC